MARKQVSGQLDLFDYINSIQNLEPYGNMEMVSLMPGQPLEEEPVKEEPVPEEPVPKAPVKEEPVDQDPVPKAPVKEEPVKEESVPEEPVEEEPVEEAAVVVETKPVESKRKEPSATEQVESKPLAEKTSGQEPPVMAKYFKDQKGRSVYVEYRNYNRLLIQYPNKPLKELQYDNSKAAVDAYVQEMLKMMEDPGLTVCG